MNKNLKLNESNQNKENKHNESNEVGRLFDQIALMIVIFQDCGIDDMDRSYDNISDDALCTWQMKHETIVATFSFKKRTQNAGASDA